MKIMEAAIHKQLVGDNSGSVKHQRRSFYYENGCQAVILDVWGSSGYATGFLHN